MSSSSSRILSRLLQSFSKMKPSSSPKPCKAFSQDDYIKRLEKADRKLKRKLQTEIIREFDDLDHSTREYSDYACPFELVDIPGDDKIIFKRDSGNEKIVIAAKMEYKWMKYVVTILKEDGSFLTFTDTVIHDIVFGYMVTCKTSDGCFKKPRSLRKNTDDLIFESIHLRNIGEDYLERRGIDHSFTQFADNYLIDRYQEDYVRFLKRVTQILDS